MSNKSAHNKEQICAGLVHAAGYALQEGIRKQEFMTLVEDVWPEMVKGHAKHLVDSMWNTATKEETVE